LGPKIVCGEFVQVERISDLSNPMLDPYRDLKKTKEMRSGYEFIAEGKVVVERLFESHHEIRSVLVAESKLSGFANRIPIGVQTLLVPDELASQLVGFDFHNGVMACGHRIPEKVVPANVVDGTEPNAQDNKTVKKSRIIVACPNIGLEENLGSILRICAAFGVAALIVGNKGAFAFGRRAIRVSMGNIFKLPIIEPEDFVGELRRLKKQFGFELVATALSENSERLECTEGGERICLLFGNEAHGLAIDELGICDRVVRLDMANDVDSLNIANAATVFLYHFSRIAQ